MKHRHGIHHQDVSLSAIECKHNPLKYEGQHTLILQEYEKKPNQ